MSQAAASQFPKPNYGIDAPAVLRNLILCGVLCIVLGSVLPTMLRLGSVDLSMKPTFFWGGGLLLAEALLYLIYVKAGKFRHRDFILSLHPWKGDEHVFDVGCGRGLLLVGAAKRLREKGHATGIDIWSTEDLSGNARDATERNLALEGVESCCTLVSYSAVEMPFADASFDVVLSNLCLHNLYDCKLRAAAIEHIARVLKPGGIAILSDYKRTSEYAELLKSLGLLVEKRRDAMWLTFPPLTVVVAQKPLQAFVSESCLEPLPIDSSF